MLQNAYFLAKIGADTAENEQDFAEILPTDAVGHDARERPRGARGRALRLGERPSPVDRTDFEFTTPTIMSFFPPPRPTRGGFSYGFLNAI